jgi:hypothetical protein
VPAGGGDFGGSEDTCHASAGEGMGMIALESSKAHYCAVSLVLMDFNVRNLLITS